MNQEQEQQSPPSETGSGWRRSPWLWAGLAAVLVLAGGLIVLISRSDLAPSWLFLGGRPVPGTPLPTSTPTGTPTPTATPTVTPTPPGSTPVAVESAGGWSFAGVRVQPHPDQGWLLVYGEAVNESGEPQRILGLQGTFYDAQGRPLTLDEYDDYWPIETVPDGERMPFELTLYGPSAVERVELQISTEPGDPPRTDFELTEVKGQEGETDYCVTGRARNLGQPLDSYLMVVAVLYNDDERVINWGIGYQPAPANLAGEETVVVSACAEHFFNTVARYELRAWGE